MPTEERITLDFTASPWEADRAKRDDAPGHYHQIDSVSVFAMREKGFPLTVADTLSRDGHIGPDEDRANALLLAAAPDLALALLAGLGIEAPGVPSGDWEKIARAALRKAGVLA